MLKLFTIVFFKTVGTTLIRLENVYKRYETKGRAAHVALDDVSWQSNEEYDVQAIGRSGAGKSTLIRLWICLSERV